MSKEDWVKEEISSNKVVVFSKTYCPYCKMAKEALKQAGLTEFLIIELDTRDDGAEIQSILQGITGQRTVSVLYNKVVVRSDA